MKKRSAISHQPSGTAALFAILLAVGACGGGSSGTRHAATDTLTERQRDSILAGSSIPGASAVGKAMTAADSTSARVRATDSVP